MAGGPAASVAQLGRLVEGRALDAPVIEAQPLGLAPFEEELAIIHGKPSIDATRRRANTRRAGIILLGSAAGLILFFVALSSIVQVREVLCGAAAGLIPLGIGAGFLIDARIQTRELDEAAFNGQSAPPAELR